jgi:class 3 adenylate cyclase
MRASASARNAGPPSLTGNEKFCGECGTPLVAQPTSVAAAPTAPPAAERRLVSVLFADLVGFTAASEARDAEDTRELLSRYFDTCRRLIELYGGTVEKFIGDAVMAVWGTPIATEDDAERAVRAALDLVAAVTALGDEVGASELHARGGVLTGEAAVTIGAEGQGMVAGDLVNTASRIQSLAEPGSVLVGETTRRATDQTIVYADAGSHELKGKTGLVPLWQALRVVSGARGALKSTGLEAPFVGRDSELRRIKDLFHACADEKRPQLISITGIAGIGKSRLAWEFYKYFDGLPQITYWHRGRCLSYGEGVTYWALADMVRMRARIAEDEEAASAVAKLAEVLEQNVPDAEERRFVEPRLRHLLGLEEGRFEREDLFAAWRLFFERLSDVYPTVLVFEDMQWADASLLDFIEYLLEWSRGCPLFVVTLARPELLERRPVWGAATKNFTSLFLEPLSSTAMEDLLAGLVPGLPQNLREQILERAEGIPLYAVETVRMLLDRGALIQEDAVYRPTATIEALEVPETLRALIAARVDGLSADERRVLQDGAVLGKTFTKEAISALSGQSEAELEPVLASLVRKEVFGVQADPRSPEHGQYGFLQDLLRRVAYETLAKADRKKKHLAAAEFLERAWGENEVVEVVASHYLDAYRTAPDASDGLAIRAKAGELLARAGERAASLAAAAEARRYFEQAAELTDDPTERAALLDRAGQMAVRAAHPDEAERLFQASIGLYEEQGDTHAAACVSGRLARVERFTGKHDEALARLERAFEVISGDEPDEDLAEISARLANMYFNSGDLERAGERAELALDIAEAHGYPKTLAMALGAKAFAAHSRGHLEEAIALMKHELSIALEHDLAEEASSSYFILSDASFHRDRYADALEYLRESIAFSRRIGNRPYEWSALAESTYALFMLGRWDEALDVTEELREEQVRSGGMFLSLLSGPLEIHLHRGQLAEARQLFALFSDLEGSTDLQERVCFYGATAALHRAEGRLREALDIGRRADEGVPTLRLSHQAIEQGVVEALEAAVALDDRDAASELLREIETLPPGRRPPLLDAHAHRFRARLDGDAAQFELAAARFREIGIPFWLAVSLVEHAELPTSEARDEEASPLLSEAREIFERLQATPWLKRVGSVAPRERVTA